MVLSANDTVPAFATHPGTILKDELAARSIKQKDFARQIGMPAPNLNEIINGKRNVTETIAARLELALGISMQTWLNLQTAYTCDSALIARRDVEEQKAANRLKLYNETFDVRLVLRRLGAECATAVEQLAFLLGVAHVDKPAEMGLASVGLFRRSSKTGLDGRMLLTWKIIAEARSRELRPTGVFRLEDERETVGEVVAALHANTGTWARLTDILSRRGITLWREEKVERASVDGYSFATGGVPHVVLTLRYDRIDSLAFSLLHELGHVYRHLFGETPRQPEPSLPDLDTREEREANAFAAAALIPESAWREAPKVRLCPSVIQREYTRWAQERGYNKWIVLGRIAHETGMYKFRGSAGRKIG